MEKSQTTSKQGLASTARTPTHDAATNSNSAFTGVALGMSWQLAIIVLIPVIGGYKLDQAVGTLPWITLGGVVVAIVGTIAVIRRALNALGGFTAAPYTAESIAAAKQRDAAYDGEDAE